MRLFDLSKFALLSFASILVVTAPAASLPENGTYYIWNSENKAVISNENGVLAYGNPIIGWYFQQPARPEQQVMVTYTGANTVTLRILEANQLNPGYEGYIINYDGHVVMHGRPQEWTIEPVPGQLGSYYIMQGQVVIHYTHGTDTDLNMYQLTTINVAEADSSSYWQFHLPYEMEKIVSA